MFYYKKIDILNIDIFKQYKIQLCAVLQKILSLNKEARNKCGRDSAITTTNKQTDKTDKQTIQATNNLHI